VEVKPVDEDSPAIEEERIEARAHWQAMKEDEVAIDTVTGEWHWWDPDTVEQKGGLAPGFRWVRELSGCEIFRLLTIPRDHR
jgi:hypothetical protein